MTENTVAKRYVRATVKATVGLKVAILQKDIDEARKEQPDTMSTEDIILHLIASAGAIQGIIDMVPYDIHEVQLDEEEEEEEE